MKNIKAGTLNPLIHQMVTSISGRDGDAAIANALEWLRVECSCIETGYCSVASLPMSTGVGRISIVRAD